MGKELVQESSLNALLEAFYNLDKRGRDGIIAAFREAADPYYPVLESGLKNNENDRVRNAAMEIYVALGEGSLPFHISLLNGADEEVRTFSGVMLGTMQDRDAVPHSLRRRPSGSSPIPQRSGRLAGCSTKKSPPFASGRWKPLRYPPLSN